MTDTSASPADGRAFLARLRSRLARDGLYIVRPLDRSAFDAVAARSGCPPLHDLMAGAAAAVVIGDGGGSFFAGFRRRHDRDGDGASAASSADPLDDYTREILRGAVAEVHASCHPAPDYRLMYPFVNAAPALPFQRLGVVAGLPEPGPLGLQVHPTYGPWWAYRGLLLVSTPLEGEPALAASCPGCSRPCVAACPGLAVTPAGFLADRCSAHRAVAPACRASCPARLGCPVGAAHGYPVAQLAFHMGASLAVMTALASAAPSG